MAGKRQHRGFRTKKVKLNEAQQQFQRSFRIEVKEIEYDDPNTGERVRRKVPVKVYPRIDEVDIPLKDLVPRPLVFG